ncbi:MAG: SOS response-associated peptidase [Candidatus Cloacimonetes bacterium]|nr:SOS response-associated peptidase [Candidatus Cloacimonadota bacterium]
MCGRFAQVIVHEQLKKLIDELEIKNHDQQMEVNFNLAPTQALGAVISKHQQHLLTFFRWGLIPSWSKEIPSFALINVRSDTILQKPSFKNGLQYRRCLIPATGFFEWKKPEKQPYFIHSTSAEFFYFAGIYDHYTAGDGSEIPSCAIITTEANGIMKPIHERMPVILSPQEIPTWLDSGFRDPASLQALLSPCPDNAIEAYPVSNIVNSVRNNSRECLQRLS